MTLAPRQWIVIVSDGDDEVAVGPFEDQASSEEWMRVIHDQRPWLNVSSRPLYPLSDGDDVPAINKALDDLENGE